MADYKFPTEVVDLPSKGYFYFDGHPLSKGKVEVKYMTAKEEDILTSRALLKKNLAIERFLQSVILDKKINVKDMLVGDRNAVLVAARASGYGETYDSNVTCPACGEKSNLAFDLENPKIHEGEMPPFVEVEETERGTYIMSLPASKFSVEIRLMTGEDENYIAHMLQSSKKNNMPENNMSEQYKRMIVSIEGYTDKKVEQIHHDHLVKNFVGMDKIISKYLND